MASLSRQERHVTYTRRLHGSVSSRLGRFAPPTRPEHSLAPLETANPARSSVPAHTVGPRWLMPTLESITAESTATPPVSSTVTTFHQWWYHQRVAGHVPVVVAWFVYLWELMRVYENYLIDFGEELREICEGIQERETRIFEEHFSLDWFSVYNSYINRSSNENKTMRMNKQMEMNK